MRKIKSLLILALLIVFSNNAFAQSGGIRGTITDKKGQNLKGALVTAYVGGINKGSAYTDEEGDYMIKPLDAGKYDIEIAYQGTKIKAVEDILVGNDHPTLVDYKFSTAKEVGGVVVRATKYTIPLVDKEGGGRHTLDSKQIEKLATSNTADAASLTAGTYQQRNGADLSIGGARGSNTKYIVDGMALPAGSGFTNPPPGSIDQISVLTGGTHAKYGDVTGGVVEITLKGVTAKTRGGIWLQHSIDGYNNNSLNFNLSGPLLTQKVDGVKRPKMGYAINGSGVYNNDGAPVYDKTPQLNSSKLAELQAHPLIATPSSTGTPLITYGSEYITKKDLIYTHRQPNIQGGSFNLSGKVDYQLASNMSLTAYGMVAQIRAKGYSSGSTIFAPEAANNSINNSGVIRSYLRFTHKFGKTAGSNAKDAGKNGISNAYYTVQADYIRDNRSSYDPHHKYNTFEYGYVGKFVENYAPIYQTGVDDSSGRRGLRLIGYGQTKIDFTRSELNPGLANYTTDYFNLKSGTTTFSQDQIYSGKGLRNGDNPSSVYSLYNNVGSTRTSWSKGRNDQVAVTVDASFDYKANKVRHNIQLGMYYQQRVERSYGVNGAVLWNIMRLLTNRVVNSAVDLSNPTFVKNGQTYTLQQVRDGVIIPNISDTILYDRKHNDTLQGAFDRSLRAKLGYLNTQYINVDALDPSVFSTSMFSATEMFNNGGNNQGVTYQGYDYTGKLQTGQVNYFDFWTKKDARGEFTRDIPAFRPNYIAGYISDYIELNKDFRFTFGLRVDRYDNNTKVLKDPYSFYDSRTVAQADGARNSLNGGVHPAGIGSDYKVYVDNPTISSPSIVGYRNGDDWYDAYGHAIADPAALKVATGGLDPAPYVYLNSAGKLVTIQDKNFDPKASFTDYKPQVNLQPRINFSFPISDVALFYAHYDVLTQRPTSNQYSSPDEMYYLQSNPSNAINNSNLKPEKLIDYEVGFQNKVNNNSSVTLTAFYKERKDQIQARKYIDAYPISYYTWGNRDFSTVKGVSVNYDLRRVGNIAMNVAYTLQFAEGTGSGPSSSKGLLDELITGGFPNTRVVAPLDIDSRHVININMDYRYKDKSGPVLFGKHIFQNAGANGIIRFRSGEPYTRYSNAIQYASSQKGIIQGGLQGSRLPWHFMFDLKLDKDFVVNVGKSKKTMMQKQKGGGLFFNAFVNIQNVLNIRDVLNVYGYTGRADDDGYLVSAQGQAYVATSVYSAVTYTDLYRQAINSPYSYNGPRRISLGLQINF